LKPLKIGILLDPAKQLMDYETQIFSNLLNDSRYEVLCTIKDGRKATNKLPIFNKFKKAKLEGALLTPLLSWILDHLEGWLLKKKGALSFDKTEVTTKISALPCIEMFPQQKGLSDVFSSEDCAKIEKLNLDVLLKHEFSIIQGEILNVPKYGIWSLQPGDNKVNRGGPGGFWEVYNNSSVTGVTLQLLGDESKGQSVIAKGYYNTENFWYLNLENALDCSVDLVFKHLRLLYEGQPLETLTSGTYSNKNFRFPTFFQTCQYIARQYSIIAFRKISKLIYRKAKIDSSKDVWKLHIGKGNIEDAVLWQTKTIEPPANEYWADPFLFEHENRTYIFFENWEYSKEKGKISVGVIKDDQITDVSDCLDLDYHLSYPFVFEHENQIFMIPETGQMKRLEIWRCDHFPNKWSLEKTRFESEGRSLVDSTIAKDANNQFWLFVNFGSRKLLEHGSNLCVFKIDSPMMNEIIPHKLNPVVSDCRSARNAGNIYIDNKGRLIRPSQASQNGIYGECLNLCHVKKLTIDSYEEEILETITPEFKNGLYSIHHVSQAGGIFVVDGGYKNR
jgi:hypothetical protein